MTTIKRITDLSDYTNVLPYSSELIGVYQPLLGWKSKRFEKRFNDGFRKDKLVLLKKLGDQFSDLVTLKRVGDDQLIIDIKPGEL